MFRSSIFQRVVFHISDSSFVNKQTFFHVVPVSRHFVLLLIKKIFVVNVYEEGCKIKNIFVVNVYEEGCKIKKIFGCIRKGVRKREF